MRVAYCSGPYRDSNLRQVIANIREAERVAIELWRLGYAVLCPHTNTQLFDGIFEEGKITTGDPTLNGMKFIEGDKEFLARLIADRDIIVMLRGWEDSEGANEERNFGIQCGLIALEWEVPTDNYRIVKLVETENGYSVTNGC